MRNQPKESPPQLIVALLIIAIPNVLWIAVRLIIPLLGLSQLDAVATENLCILGGAYGAGLGFLEKFQEKINGSPKKAVLVVLVLLVLFAAFMLASLSMVLPLQAAALILFSVAVGWYVGGLVFYLFYTNWWLNR